MNTTNTDQPVPDWIIRYIESGDELGLILRCHMELESLLDKILEVLFPIPERLAKMQLNYYLKVQLALSMGVSPKLEGVFKFYGTVRNKFAHRPDQKISKGDAKNLYKILPPEIRTMVLDTFKHVIAPSTPKLAGIQWRNLPPAFQFFVMWTCVATVVEEIAEDARKESDRLDGKLATVVRGQAPGI